MTHSSIKKDRLFYDKGTNADVECLYCCMGEERVHCMVDLIIKNARIIDGTGAPWYRGDVAVEDGEIVCVGLLKGVDAKEVVDAQDQYLCPGFIDMHTHSDQTVFSYPLAESRVFQGITTEITGNCGISLAPVNPEKADLLEKYTSHPVREWQSVGEYLDVLEKHEISVNTGVLVGHGAIRIAVMGFSDKKATEEEIRKMQALTRESMECGAFGISTGLIYPPGCYSDTEELIAIVGEVKPYGGYYATHMRDEKSRVVESVEESLRIARETGVPLHVSHHKVSYKPDWHTSCRKTIALMEEARREGIDVTADQYPYNASATNLSVNLPTWAFEGGVEKLLERLRDPEIRTQLEENTNASHEGRWDTIYVSCLKTEENAWMQGKSIVEIAETLGKDNYASVLIDIVLAEDNEVDEICFGMCEEDVEYIMTKEFVMTGSDGSAMSLDFPGKPHPRNFGTFVRTLSHYCRDRGLFSLERAVQRQSALPAARLGLSDRGLIKSGMKADLVLFDFEKLEDLPDYQKAQRACSGIRRVYVNGILTVIDGTHTGAKAGMILRKEKNNNCIRV